MKRTVFGVTAVMLAVVAVSLAFFRTAPATPSVDSVPDSAVVTVANSANGSSHSQKVLQARFLNMLNHNFVYGSDFETVEGVVNSSVIALLDMREDENSSFINQAIVSDYIFNMYGIEDADFSAINADAPQKEGYVYIMPRGYSVYSHTINSVAENPDGSYTVITDVSVSSHDGVGLTERCETLFVPNSASQFGFCIIYSNMQSSSAAI
ncbi:MAG: hypothetical protein IKD04_00400 [Clostridia bacterium]|nr:hypothetical protein [Clostridia bacterium]